MRKFIVIAAIASIGSLWAAGCSTKTEPPRAAETPLTAAVVAPKKKLFIDVHRFGPGKVNAEAVAGAHAKDLAVEAKHQVKYLDYWFDAASGTVFCLSEAPSAEAALAVHREAHGLLPESIEELSAGR